MNIIIDLRFFVIMYSGRGAVRLAHMTGGHGVGGSNPLAPNLLLSLACKK